MAPLRPAWPDLRWTGRAAWHLTLAFLGEVNEAISQARRPGWSGPRTATPACPCPSAGAGAFPGAARARVLWTGVQGDRRARPPGRIGGRRAHRRAGAPAAGAQASSRT